MLATIQGYCNMALVTQELRKQLILLGRLRMCLVA